MPKSIAQTTPSSLRGEAVRAKLLDAAVHLIVERGWSAVSTRMLAERAGVAPGLVHYHFDSVQGVLRAAALGSIRDVLESATATFGDLTAREAITEMIRSLEAFPGNDPITLLVSEAYLAASRDPELRTRLADEIARFRGSLSSLFDDAGDPDAGASAAVVAAMVDGLMLHRALGAGEPADSVTRVALRLLDGRVS